EIYFLWSLRQISSKRLLGAKIRSGTRFSNLRDTFVPWAKKKALKRTPGLFPFPTHRKLCFLLQFKGNRNTEWNLHRPSPLFSRGHFGQSFDDSQSFGFQVFVRSPHSDVPYAPVLLDHEHDTHPTLYPHFLGNFRITEILDDMGLDLFLKTGFLVLGVLTAGENGHVLDYGKGNGNIFLKFLDLNLLDFHDFLFLT